MNEGSFQGISQNEAEADARYWRDAVRLRWLITLAFFALTLTGVLPYRQPWFVLASALLVGSTAAYTVYRRRTSAYTLTQDVFGFVDVVTISLVLLSIGTIDHPLWIAYVLVIAAVSNFKGHRFNAVFMGFVLASFGAVYAYLAAAGGAGSSGQVAVVTAVLLLFTSINATIISANNQRLRKVISQQAQTDPLTGLANRRVLFERLEAWQPAERQLAAMMIDLDDFKVLNESLGHMTADLLLARVGRVLTESTPEGALAARFGGDEFAVLIDVADCAEAQELADRLIVEAREAVGIGLTIGIALCPNDAPTPERALHLADGNLRRAKSAGKERALQRRAA